MGLGWKGSGRYLVLHLFGLPDFLHLPCASPSADTLSCFLSLHSCSNSMHKQSLYLTPFHLQPTRSSEHISHLPSYFSPHTYFQVSSDLWAFWLCNNRRVPVPDPSPWHQSQHNLLSPVSPLSPLTEPVSLRWKNEKSLIFQTPKIKE